MGVGVHCNQAYIIDFGLAKEFRDARTHVHIPFRQDYDFLTGTTPYASLNNHQGIEQSRRDDLESLVYIFIYFFCGSLPWQNAKTSTDKQRDMILRKKLDSLPKLLRALPDEFSTFLDYTRALRFEDKPDYAYLRKLFHDFTRAKGTKTTMLLTGTCQGLACMMRPELAMVQGPLGSPSMVRWPAVECTCYFILQSAVLIMALQITFSRSPSTTLKSRLMLILTIIMT